MAILKVDCVTPEGTDGYDRIDALGGDGFYHTAEVAIRNIQSNLHTYYMVVGGNVALIDVRQDPASGDPCLRVISRSFSGEDLLNLPECEQSDGVSVHRPEKRGRPGRLVPPGRPSGGH